MVRQFLMRLLFLVALSLFLLIRRVLVTRLMVGSLLKRVEQSSTHRSRHQTAIWWCTHNGHL